MRLSIPFAALAIVAAVRTEAATLLAETATAARFGLKPTAASYAVDSLTTPIGLRYRAGDTLTLTAPDGTATTPVAAAGSCGTNFWTASSGGVWTAADSNEGEVSFRVWHSLFGLQGAGTEANPAKVVDAGDFAAMFALAGGAEGFVFTADGGDAGSLDMPQGFATEALEGGAYRLVATAGGLLCASPAEVFPLDTAMPGPDRKLNQPSDALPFAYSGDSWTRTNSNAASTLSFSSPGGATTMRNGVGEGALTFPLTQHGVWTVALSADGFETLVARIGLPTGTTIIMR